MDDRSEQSGWRIGVDTGGTFTDVVLADPRGMVQATHKLLSTPDDPGRAVLAGVAAVMRAEVFTQGDHQPSLPAIVHGSTVATNAVLEGKGDRAVLLTTAGFEDLLTLARQNRPELYALSPRRSQPPIPRELTLGVAERIGYDGSVLDALRASEVDHVVEKLASLKPDAVVICLLHSYANPAHERLLAKAIQSAIPGVHLTVSSTLLPEMREYERTATCAVNAMVGPMMSRYVGRLAAELGEGRLRVMGTGGGTLSPDAVRERPVETIMSGPAGGVMGAWAMAQSAGETRVIGFDMGGTSTDVSLCDGGPTRTTQSEVAGLPIKLAMIDIHTVGAGGGSIAWIDAGGALRVGPQSAGADPGPACYGKQTGDPIATVTDAHAVLGHIRDQRPLGDSLTVDRHAAVRSVRSVADRLGMGVEDAAEGILRVADAAMARAIQQVSVQRGHDARRFTLIAFGGAGGLHACRLAELLGMTRVLIPVQGGLLSALGMLAAPPRFAFSHALPMTFNKEASRYDEPLEHPNVAEALEQLRALGHQALEADGVAEVDRVFNAALDLRFAGQSFEITVPAEDGQSVIAAFRQEHRRLYGYAPDDQPIELVTARLEALGPRPTITPGPGRKSGKARAKGSEPDTLNVFDRGEQRPWQRIDRDTLEPGSQLTGGRAIIEEYAATTVVPPGWSLRVLDDGQVLLTRDATDEGASDG